MAHPESTSGSPAGSISRRRFLAGSAAAGLFTVVPRHVLGGAGFKPPSERLNVALIGANGRGHSLASQIGDYVKKVKIKEEEGKEEEGKKPEPRFKEEHHQGENLVALVDVDDDRCAETAALFPKAARYRDFRKMLETEKGIDAVLVATPDHFHAVAAMAAIQLGKHVYCEKPMTHSIHEARLLTQAARWHRVATQMGNQGHAGEGIRLLCEWIWAGAIGEVREVHAWTNRPIWPQGIDRPPESMPVPANLDWDLWLGPAPERPYHSCYHPFKWRGWWDFGTGALGDMGCHILDPIFTALRLGPPARVEASATRVNDETAPLASAVHYWFPARGGLPPVKLHWYDGGIMPERPEELEPGRRMGDSDGGCLFVGDKGKLMCGCYGASPRLIPETTMKDFKRPEKTLARSPGHMEEFVAACKGGRPAGSDFDYAGPLTEAILLGNVAIRLGKPLAWDATALKVTNLPDAEALIRREYRQGWALGTKV